MKTIVAIYTGKGLQDPLSALISQMLPGFRQVSIIDDNIIGECVKAGEVTANVKSLLNKYYKAAVDMGADIILNTCSSVGDVADAAAPASPVPLIRIDEAMAIKAVENHKKIAVVATLPTTLDPTLRFIKAKAKLAGKEIEAISGLAEGAFDALISGDPAKHDEIIKSTVEKLAKENADCIVLAQASMMRMEKALNDLVDIPVYASPPLCFEALAK
ncbi:MAG: aspartate/glutamate racemase family protein [Defluviitaleaceae bacterium]|nr:aspartate/glutamate racemase family protein [Defluviitaleaceae bacterium]